MSVLLKSLYSKSFCGGMLQPLLWLCILVALSRCYDVEESEEVLSLPDTAYSRYRCTGPLAKYSHGDCEVTANHQVCYYIDTIFAYKSCATDCNMVRKGTSDEERCESYPVCAKYLRTNCVLETVRPTGISVLANTTSAGKANEIAGHSTTIAIILAVAFVVVLGAVIALAVYCFRRRVQSRRDSQLIKDKGDDEAGCFPTKDGDGMGIGSFKGDQKPVMATDTNDCGPGRQLTY
ncbi:uncharacterized protein [Watersipora subatra]|uniref:uncharacterized protein n=1 Tax=Watersipora subatra TaxID=2589382 RepID=UPI00355B3CB9